MEMQLEWVQMALELFLNNSRIEMKQQIELATELEKMYISYPKEIKDDIRKLFKEQLDTSSYIYVFSYLIQRMNIEDFYMDIMEAILKQEYNWYIGTMLEIQTTKIVKGQYSQKKLFHKKNIERYSELVKLDYNYLPIEKRNKKRIVIATEQLLSLQHAPTKIILEFAYILQKEFGYEILLIVCQSDGILPDRIWYNDTNMNSIANFRSVDLEITYKGENFYGYQICMTVESIDIYHRMLNFIYKYNPLFVFNMGIINSITELAKTFTTVVTMNMNSTCPISEGDILIRSSKVPEMEDEYKRCLAFNQKQVFLEEKMPVITEKNYTVCTREELSLPKDKFLIAIVGNRLDNEISTEFVEIMRDILNRTKEVVFAIIGEVSRMKEYFSEEIFEERIYYLGYCTNLMGVYSEMNLYLNPKRVGGGFSGAMAMIAGVPVVTLPNCDVAENCGDEFVVCNEEDMINTVCRYIEDEEFYASKKQIAKMNGEKHTDENMKNYVKHVMDKIIEAMGIQDDSI